MLSAPQLDEGVCDVGDRDAETGRVPDRLPVVAAVHLEGRERVLALLDCDADVAPLRLAGRGSGLLRGLSLGRGGGIADINGRCEVSWCPGHRTGRFIDMPSTSVEVAEVDDIELPVDHDCEVSSRVQVRDDKKNPCWLKS